MGGKVLILLWYVSALTVYIGQEGEVALDAPSRCKVNFEPKTVAAGRAGHTAEGGSFTGWVSVQRNLKGDSTRRGADRRRTCIVGLLTSHL